MFVSHIERLPETELHADSWLHYISITGEQLGYQWRPTTEKFTINLQRDCSWASPLQLMQAKRHSLRVFACVFLNSDRENWRQLQESNFGFLRDERCGVSPHFVCRQETVISRRDWVPGCLMMWYAIWWLGTCSFSAEKVIVKLVNRLAASALLFIQVWHLLKRTAPNIHISIGID